MIGAIDIPARWALELHASICAEERRRIMSLIGWKAFDVEMASRKAFPWPMGDPMPCAEVAPLVDLLDELGES